MCKLIYLDSSDFSDLSALAEQLRSDDRILLQKLRQYREKGSVKFFVSSIHISEAIHAAANHKQSAVRRAALMKELCGSNMLALPNDVYRLEINNAGQKARANATP